MIVDTQISLLAEKLRSDAKTGDKADTPPGFEAVMAALITVSSPANTISQTGIELLPTCLNVDNNERLFLQDIGNNSAQRAKIEIIDDDVLPLPASGNEQMYGWSYDSKPPPNLIMQHVADGNFTDNGVTEAFFSMTKLQTSKAELHKINAAQQNILLPKQGSQQGKGIQETAELMSVQATVQPEESLGLQELQQAYQRGKPLSTVYAASDIIPSERAPDIFTSDQELTMLFEEKSNSVLSTTFVETPAKEVIELNLEPQRLPARDIAQELPRIIFSHQKIGQNGEGSKEFVIQLDPEDMGRMAVKLNSHKGVVSVRIFAENQDARSIIENSLQSLRQSFEEQGIKCGHIDVELGGQYLNQNNSQQYQSFHNSYTDSPQDWKDRQYYASLEMTASEVCNQSSISGTIDYRV